MLVYRREAYIKNNEVALAFQCRSITACISLEDDSYQTAGVSIAHFSGDDFFVCVWKNVINLVAFVFHFLAFIFMEGRRTRGKPGGEECWLLLQESKEQRSPWQAASKEVLLDTSERWQWQWCHSPGSVASLPKQPPSLLWELALASYFKDVFYPRPTQGRTSDTIYINTLIRAHEQLQFVSLESPENIPI